MINKLLLAIFLLTFSSFAHAKTVEIEMLNKLGKERMLYSVKLAEVDVNDKIIWKSTDKGHNVEFVVMPKGVKKFKASNTKKTRDTNKKVNKNQNEVFDVCTILKKCSIDEISKYLLNEGKNKDFPDITMRE